MKSVAVYCGHQFGTNPEFKRDAAKFGELLARNKIRLVFGAGDVGLMGAVCNGALENGGEVIGVTTPAVLALQEPAHKGIKIEIVPVINERKQKMFDMSDAFCILPGGIGTLNELTDILTMHQIGESQKPIFFLNTGKFWNIFGRIMVHMDQMGFIADMKEYNINVCDTPEQMINLITQRKDLCVGGCAANKFDV